VASANLEEKPAGLQLAKHLYQAVNPAPPVCAEVIEALMRIAPRGKEAVPGLRAILRVPKALSRCPHAHGLDL
jgi:hypothetical protein